MKLIDSYSPPEQMRSFRKAVELGLWPWKPGSCVIFRNYLIDSMEDEIVLEISLLPDLPFTFTITRRLALAHPDQIFLEIAEAAFKFYRYRPALPVDDHVILGEN